MRTGLLLPTASLVVAAAGIGKGWAQSSPPPGPGDSSKGVEAQPAEGEQINKFPAYGALPGDKPATRTTTALAKPGEAAAANVPLATTRFRTFGASTLTGAATLRSVGPQEGGVIGIRVDVEGAAPGSYELMLGDEGSCARPYRVQVDVDASKGSDRSGVAATQPGETPTDEGAPAPAAPPKKAGETGLETARSLGAFFVGVDGRGHFDDLLTSLPRDRKVASFKRRQLFILERRGSVNPSLADDRGVVACGVIAPASGLEPAS